MILDNEDRIPSHIYEHIYLDGRIDVDRLAEAVSQVAVIVPETLWRLDARHVRFKQAGFTVGDVVTESQHLDCQSDCGFPWDLRGDTQVKIRVIHGPRTDSLVIGFSHVLADGMGVLEYVSLLADAYNGVLRPVRNERSADEIMASATFGPQTESEKRASEIASMGLPYEGGGKEYHCYRVTLSVSTMDRIHSLARSQSATLNDVFFTACARVAARILDVDQIAMRCPVDLRPLVAPRALTVANLTSLYRMAIDVGKDDSFSTTLEQVHQEILLQRERRRYLFDFPTLAAIPAWYPMFLIKRAIRRDYLVRPVNYSNCGIQPHVDFAGVGVELSFMTGAYAAYPEFPVTVSSFNGTTTFAVTLMGDEERADAGEKTLGRIIKEMEDWVRDASQS